MSEMIERVAAALRASHGTTGHTFEDDARAAIKALREPTEDMIVSGSWAPNGRGEVGSFGARNAYNRMIDAALKENA